MIYLRNFLTIITLSFFFSACNESASSKINPNNKSSIQKESNYAEITFDRVFHDFGMVSEGEIVKVKVLEVDKQGRVRLSMKAANE